MEQEYSNFEKLSEIKIRYNTEKEKIDSSLPAWRVLIDGVEHLAMDVVINTVCKTTQDQLPDGRQKWHFTCHGKAIWQEGVCYISN